MNTHLKTQLYRSSSIKDILRIVRERAVNPQHRTKKWIAEQLGISTTRITGIEDGTSQVDANIAFDWCKTYGDQEALDAILHIYGVALPPTDPRLLENVSDQIINLEKQLTEALEATQQMKQIILRKRPGRQLPETQFEEMHRFSKEILDVEQASKSFFKSMQTGLGLCLETVQRYWISKALADGVAVSSVSEFESIRRARTEFYKGGVSI